MAAVNRFVDPYRLRVLERTPQALTEAQGAFLHTALAVAAVKPKAVILGTSRAANALEASHPRFRPDDAPVMNLALGAASIRQTRLMLVHAHESSGVRKAVIGLDLEAFLGASRPDFEPAALRGNRDSEPEWIVLVRAMTSRDMFFAAIGSWAGGLVAANAKPDAAAPKDRFQDRLNSLEGQRGLVWITEFNNFYAQLPLLFPGASDAWRADGRRANAMRDFRELLDYARANDIELRMFVSPVHARYLEWYRRVGWWPLFENCKRALAESLQEEAKGAPARRPFTIWDFSGFHPLATEPVPRIGDLRSRMRWYWESSHYSRATGDLILDAVLRSGHAASSPLPDVTIDSSTIEQHLNALRVDADRYRQAFPGEAANVAEMVRYLRRIARK